MVFFNCEGCNETLKKNQVDKHVHSCRKCYAVTCIDCQKSFAGDDYAEHTSCISEAEKYEKGLYKPKKEKLNPQDAWMECVSEAASRAHEAPLSIRSFLGRISQQANVPRQKNKFFNFCKNSLRISVDKIVNEIWDFLEKCRGSNKVDGILVITPTVADEVSSTVATRDGSKHNDDTCVDDANDTKKILKNKKQNKKMKKKDKKVDTVVMQEEEVPEEFRKRKNRGSMEAVVEEYAQEEPKKEKTKLIESIEAVVELEKKRQKKEKKKQKKEKRKENDKLTI